MPSIGEIIKELTNSGIVETFRPADRQEIEAEARVLAVKFPAVYVDFLLTTGYLRIYKTAVFGLGPDARQRGPYVGWTVTKATLTARAEDDVRLPPHLVAIWHDSHRDYQCLDTSQIRRGDCPIVYYDTEIAARRNPRPRQVARGFIEWLRDRVRQGLADKAAIEADPIFPSMKRRARTKRWRSK